MLHRSGVLMQKLPEDRHPAGIVTIGVQIPVVEVRPVIVRLEVERVSGGLPQLLSSSSCWHQKNITVSLEFYSVPDWTLEKDK